jgi:hypothetical protein
MARILKRARIAFAPAVLAAAAVPASAQPARVPASVLGPPAERFAAHPYKSALGAVANYQSCGALARAAAAREVATMLRALEAEAVAKGLGPILDRLRQEYQELLAVSTMTACGGGPRRALAGARAALADFRAWVEAQPGR